MLLLKKWLHASHSLSYSPFRISKPFTSSTSTWGSILPAGTLGSFGLGSFSGVGGFGGWLLWSPFSLDGSCWGVPTSPDSGSSGGWSPWLPTSTKVPRELISFPPACTLQKNIRSRCYNCKDDGHFGRVQQAYLCCH